MPRESVRGDFVPKTDYLSREFLGLENEMLWPRVWQVVCRNEELPAVGDYVVYDIADESILVVRVAADRIKAYYNVCQHRGRQLRDGGCGHAQAFQCRFHGWRWKLDGSLDRVVDRHDWEGCASFSDGDLRLKEVRVDQWGGWVFVNMDSAAAPLGEYLAPVQEYLDPFEFHKMRYRWYKTVVLPCNWKVALEAFNEGYHVAATHPQLLETIGDDVTTAHLFGKHGMFAYQGTERPYGAPSARTGKPVPPDLRPGIVSFFAELERTLKAIYSPRAAEAVARLLSEVPADAAPAEIFARLMAFQKEAAVASGAGWPEISIEQLMRAGTNWHLFPNYVVLMAPDGAITYRARPNGGDPDSCLFDIWSLVRYAPGAEPVLKREFYADCYADTEKNFGRILAQDIHNMGRVQKGMKSRGFAGARTNPKQEASVSNFHRVLHQHLFG
jgi:phenylpropionate dioxygenase-like ring-hydroxylating dioxygenase large terminal subunit